MPSGFPAAVSPSPSLATTRDVALQALGRAQDEAFKAKNRLAATRERLGDPAPTADLQSLAHLVARLRQTDPEVQKTRAEQDLALRNSELSNAMIALAPWSGAPQELVKLKVPAPWQISAWEAADQTTSRTLRDAREAFERLYFEHHLKSERGNMTRVADKTGLERTHLYRKLKQLGLNLGRRTEDVQ